MSMNETWMLPGYAQDHAAGALGALGSVQEGMRVVTAAARLAAETLAGLGQAARAFGADFERVTAGARQLPAAPGPPFETPARAARDMDPQQWQTPVKLPDGRWVPQGWAAAKGLLNAGGDPEAPDGAAEPERGGRRHRREPRVAHLVDGGDLPLDPAPAEERRSPHVYQDGRGGYTYPGRYLAQAAPGPGVRQVIINLPPGASPAQLRSMIMDVLDEELRKVSVAPSGY
jgi:hypothetical protein